MTTLLNTFKWVKYPLDFLKIISGPEKLKRPWALGSLCHMMWSRCIPYTSFPNIVASWYFDEKKSCIVEYYTFFAPTATRMYQGLYLHKRNRVSLPRSSFHLVSYESQKAEFNISIDDKRCPIEEKGNGIYLFFTPKRIQ